VHKASMATTRHTGGTPVEGPSAARRRLQVGEGRGGGKAKVVQGGPRPLEHPDGRSPTTLGQQMFDHSEVAVLLVGRELDRPLQEAAGLVEVLVAGGVVGTEVQ
jgi:hypothetical protein